MVLKLGHFGGGIRKNRENSKVWHWRRMEKICRTDRIENKVLHRVQEKINTSHTIKWKKAGCNVHMSPKNCLLKHVIERKLEATRRRERRRTQLPDNFIERKRYWNSKKKAVDCTGRGYGPCRKTDEEMNGLTKSVWLFQHTDYFTIRN